MNDHQLSVLIQKADDGIQGDGLSIVSDGDGYQLRIGRKEHNVSSRDELEHIMNDHPRFVTNWYFWDVEVGRHGSARRRFLRWLERTERMTVPERYDAMQSGPFAREWGELSISIRLKENGERVYELTHSADRNREMDELEVHVDPLDARHLAKFNEQGSYRPLKGAPNLRSGWVFPGLRHDKLIQTVDYFYPASVANWFRERNDRLDVTSFQEAAERHTGIYANIGELSSDQLNTLVANCCTDQNCIKRRRWEETSTKKIEVPSGDGHIPCREPCPYLVNEAREIVTSDSKEHVNS